MTITHFLTKGIHFRDPHLTRNPRLWTQYLCWCIWFQMTKHRPILPGFIRRWAFRHYGNQRFHLSWRMVDWWKSQNPNFVPTVLPLPWPLGEAALGPFVGPWERITRWFRNHTGGRSHRCEFTDRKIGALYGGQQGDFMNRLFEQFVDSL